MLWVISSVLFVVFLVCAAGNGVGVIIGRVRNRSFSVVPFVGGVSGVLGCVIAPSKAVNRYWWIPPLVDLGCIPLLVVLAIYFARKLFAKHNNKKNTV